MQNDELEKVDTQFCNPQGVTFFSPILRAFWNCTSLTDKLYTIFLDSTLCWKKCPRKNVTPVGWLTKSKFSGKLILVRGTTSWKSERQAHNKSLENIVDSDVLRMLADRKGNRSDSVRSYQRLRYRLLCNFSWGYKIWVRWLLWHSTPFAECIRQMEVHTKLYLVAICSNYIHKHKMYGL